MKGEAAERGADRYKAEKEKKGSWVRGLLMLCQQRKDGKKWKKEGVKKEIMASDLEFQGLECSWEDVNLHNRVAHVCARSG